MKQANQALSQVRATLEVTQRGLTTSTSKPVDSAAIRAEKRLVAERINELYDDIVLRCRNCPDELTVEQHKKILTKLLRKNRLGGWAVVLRAKERVCTGDRWYPLPDDLVQHCIDIAGEELGLPDEREAFIQAFNMGRVRGDRRHPAVIHTLQQMDPHEKHRLLKTDNEDQAAKRWRKHWTTTREFLRHGGEISLPKKLEQAPKAPPLSRAENKTRMAQLKQELSLA